MLIYDKFWNTHSYAWWGITLYTKNFLDHDEKLVFDQKSYVYA